MGAVLLVVTLIVTGIGFVGVIGGLVSMAKSPYRG